MKNVLVIGCLSGLLLSLRLWISTRTYPLIPVFERLPQLYYPYDLILFLVLLISLVTIFIFRRPKIAFAVFIVLAIFLSILDQSRWQPWWYQYLFMLSALAICYIRPRQKERLKKAAINTCRFIVAAIYFWSGIQKINPIFIFEVLPWMMAPMNKLFPGVPIEWLSFIGVLAPFIEIGMGIGLLTKSLRSVSVIAAVIMHGFILFAIGPFGHNWNSVVWPWNITMIFLVTVLFWRVSVSFKELIKNQRFWFHYVVIILFGAMPALNFFGLWDAYLSAVLYSGNISSATITMSRQVKAGLPTQIRPYVEPLANDQYILNLANWSLGELNVPPYPEARIFASVAKSVCRYSAISGDVIVNIYDYPTPISTQPQVVRFSCESINI